MPRVTASKPRAAKGPDALPKNRPRSETLAHKPASKVVTRETISFWNHIRDQDIKDPLNLLEKKYVTAHQAFETSMSEDTAIVTYQYMRNMNGLNMEIEYDKARKITEARMRMSKAEEEKDRRWIEWVEAKPDNHVSAALKKHHREIVDARLAEHKALQDEFTARLDGLERRYGAQLSPCY
jgi:hypothetical protein